MTDTRQGEVQGFVAVDDERLVTMIRRASRRIVCVCPGVSGNVGKALNERASSDDIPVTVVVDEGEEANRIGYGDTDGLESLRHLAEHHPGIVQRHPGVRIALLVADDEVLLWAPTARAIEDDRKEGEPNGIVLGGGVATTMSKLVAPPNDHARPLPGKVGGATYEASAIAPVIEALRDDPPVPYDLARRTRVFSTKFQFVEFRRLGAGWKTREINLSRLLNSDAPAEIRDRLDSAVRPFAHLDRLAVDLPMRVEGEAAYRSDGEPFLVSTTEADLDARWRSITHRYLVKLEGFGWIVRRREKDAFQHEAAAFEQDLGLWVDGFLRHLDAVSETIRDQLLTLMEQRWMNSADVSAISAERLAEELKGEFERFRRVEPGVKLVFRDISWESTRDAEFLEALRSALPRDEVEGWFEEFGAARERRQS